MTYVGVQNKTPYDIIYIYICTITTTTITSIRLEVGRGRK